MNGAQIRSRPGFHELLFALVTSFIFLFDFRSSSFRSGGEGEWQICWPHWESCRLLPMPGFYPDSYANSALFSLVFVAVLVVLWGVYRRDEKTYISALWGLVLFKVFYNFFWRFTGLHNFEYFHLIPTLAFLLNPKNRIWAAQISWAFCYFLSASVKISDGWIVGTYFSSLSHGLPLVPDFGIPLITNGVIVFEIVSGWALLTKRWGKWSFLFWTAFHSYSVILVGFHYPVRCIGMLWALFLPAVFPDRERVFEAANGKRVLQLPALSLLSLMFVMQVLPLVFAEDARRTLRFEGYGFNMFDANFQCQSEMIVHKAEERSFFQQQIDMARYRCSPRTFLQRAHQLCRERNADRVELRVVQSANGQPFYRIIDLPNACQTEFSMFGQNDWIDMSSARMEGYPQPNAVNGRALGSRSSIVASSPKLFLSPLQEFLQSHLVVFKVIYLLLWSATFFFVCWKYFGSADGRREDTSQTEDPSPDRRLRKPI
jgi:hypothetical protein